MSYEKNNQKEKLKIKFHFNILDNLYVLMSTIISLNIKHFIEFSIKCLFY